MIRAMDASLVVPPPMDELRSQFPVLERMAYLNAGSVGPVPRAAAARRREAELASQLENGRGGKAYVRAACSTLSDRLRGRVAAVLGCDSGEVALTGATTDGVNAVLAASICSPGDEVLTSDEEHPGLLAPLGPGAASAAASSVRVVPFDELAERGRPAHAPGRLLARVLDHRPGGRHGRRSRPPACPVLLDGAQGLGAVPVDVRRSAATTTRPRARSGSAGRSAAATSTCAPTASTSSRPPRPATDARSDATRSRRSSCICARAPRASTAASRRPPHRLGAGRARRAGGGRARRSPRARGRPGATGSPTRCRRGRTRSRRAGARRWSRGRQPIPRRGRSACGRRASCVRHLPGHAATCARRWAPGQRGASWTRLLDVALWRRATSSGHRPTMPNTTAPVITTIAKATAPAPPQHRQRRGHADGRPRRVVHRSACAPRIASAKAAVTPMPASERGPDDLEQRAPSRRPVGERSCTGLRRA